MDILLGCGHSRDKRLSQGRTEWNDLCTVDVNLEVNPKVVWDMNNIPLPFDNNVAEEIHAYNVLEHTGAQGDYKFFFKQFENLWNILKPGGIICASVPSWESVWAFGDPGHTRVINEGTLSFLDQDAYNDCDKSMRTDYRNIYKGNLKLTYSNTDDTGTLYFVLKAVK